MLRLACHRRAVGPTWWVGRRPRPARALHVPSLTVNVRSQHRPASAVRTNQLSDKPPRHQAAASPCWPLHNLLYGVLAAVAHSLGLGLRGRSRSAPALTIFTEAVKSPLPCLPGNVASPHICAARPTSPHHHHRHPRSSATRPDGQHSAANAARHPRREERLATNQLRVVPPLNFRSCTTSRRWTCNIDVLPRAPCTTRLPCN